MSGPLRVTDDRRRSPRYPAVSVAAWLGWWEAGAFRRVAATPLDVSMSGVALRIEGAPPKAATVFVVMPGGPPAWRPARLVRAKKPLWGPTRLQLELAEPWGYDEFKAIAYGERANDIRPPEADPIDPEGRDFFR